MLVINQLVVVVAVLACTVAGLTKKEAACFARDQFYHGPTDKCYELLHQGPCPEGEWWVLRKPLKSDKEVIVKGVCEKDQCKDSGLFWPGKGCVGVSQKKELCGSDPRAILTNNDFGEGECMCYKSPPHARLDDNPDNLCYELNLQGPCQRREILAIPADSSVPKCIPDPCFYTAFKLKKANQLPVSAVMAMYNGTCYQLETQGPCPQGQTFKIIYESMMPGCEQLTTAIFDGLEKHEENEKVVSYASDQYRKKQIAAIKRRRRRMT